MKSDDYINFCKNTDREYWGFIVSKIELGKAMTDCEDVGTHQIHCDLDDITNDNL